MGTTTNRALRYPAGSNAINIPIDIKNLADDVDAQLGADSGWVDLAGLVSGWSVPGGQVAQVRQIGGLVYGRGYLQNSSFAGGFTTCAALPSGIAAPPYVAMLPMGGNTTLSRSWQVTAAGAVQAFTEGATAAFYSLWSLRYSTT